MSEQPGRAWHFYLDDMMAFAQKALDYTADLDQDSFVARSMVYDATLRNLALIGEAATRIPAEIRAAHPEIPWRLIIATRNRVIHAYLGLDNDTLWSIVQDDLPALLIHLQALSARYAP